MQLSSPAVDMISLVSGTGVLLAARFLPSFAQGRHDKLRAVFYAAGVLLVAAALLS